MFKPFTTLTSKEQKEINSRYILPIDLTNLVVNESKTVPYEIICGAKVSCTLKTNRLICGGFHTHAIRV